jgi:hypothetical protein
MVSVAAVACNATWVVVRLALDEERTKGGKKRTGRFGVRSVHEALGIYTHDVHRRWGG